MSPAYREEEHAFMTLERDIRSGKVPGLVLLCGKEEYLIRWYTDVLVKKYVADAGKALDHVVMEGEDVDVDRIAESLDTVSVMSERKVVVLPDFPPARGQNLKGFSEKNVKELIGIFDQIPEGSMLIITAADDDDTRNRRNKIRNAAEKSGKVYDFQPLNDGQLKSFIEKRFNNAGKEYAPSVIKMIMSESGYGNKAIEYSLYNLENDIRKIIAHSGAAKEITAEDVRPVLATNPENNVFAMLDAIGRNRKDEAFRLLNNLLESGTPVFNLLMLITNQLELILSVKEMKEEGMSLSEMQKTLGVHQFRVKKALSVTGRYSTEELRSVLSSAYQVDENIKTGLFDGRLALEYFIASI